MRVNRLAEDGIVPERQSKDFRHAIVVGEGCGTDVWGCGDGSGGGCHGGELRFHDLDYRCETEVLVIK